MVLVFMSSALVLLPSAPPRLACTNSTVSLIRVFGKSCLAHATTSEVVILPEPHLPYTLHWDEEGDGFAASSEASHYFSELFEHHIFVTEDEEVLVGTTIHGEVDADEITTSKQTLKAFCHP